MANFLDDHQIVSGFVPVDICAQANTGDYVCLRDWERCLVVLFKAAGTAGDDPTITLVQATDVAASGVKTLACITKSWVKSGAALTAIGTFTAASQTAAATLAGSATSAEEQAIMCVEVRADQLDVANGFDCLMASVADPGAAGTQYAGMLYILSGPRNAAAVAPTAIA